MIIICYYFHIIIMLYQPLCTELDLATLKSVPADKVCLLELYSIVVCIS